MTRIRNVGGKITEYTGGNEIMYAKESIVYNATGPISFTSDTALKFGKPKTPSAGKFFVKGWWTDSKDKPIKKAYIGDTIRFHIKTKDVPDGEYVMFNVYDWDGMLNPDDKVNLVIAGTNTEYNKIKITGNKGYIEWTTGVGSQSMIEEEGDDEIELYVKCTYKTETVDLPDFSDDYLILYEKEVLITVIIELPHSHYSLVKAAKNLDKNEALSALGLAGHSAMAIGDRYFDYGPDYDLDNNGSVGDVVKISEKEYDYDFNNDGDKNDIIDFQEKRDPTNAPGRPWWGEIVADRLGIKSSDVKINQVLDFIKLHWYKDGTNIYGEVYKTEFYVKESEAKKMIKWWEERYKHLKVYSVLPWTGEQCTTTVKLAIHEAFPYIGLKNTLAKATQRPAGLLSDLKKFISTSKEHSGKLAKQTIIKQEAIDYPKKP